MMRVGVDDQGHAGRNGLAHVVVLEVETLGNRVDLENRRGALGGLDHGIDVGIVEVHVAITDWYAPGVGLVKRERREWTDSPFINDGEYRLELEAWGK